MKKVIYQIIIIQKNFIQKEKIILLMKVIYIIKQKNKK